MRRAGLLLVTLLLGGCEQKLAKEELELLDAMVFAINNVEDNTQEKHKLAPWKRTVEGRAVTFVTLGRHSYGFSDDELNKMLRNSSYVRYTERISSPEKCIFHLESKAELSKADSTADFSVYDMGSGTTIFNLNNTTKFEIDYSRPDANAVFEGPAVACWVGHWCTNTWTKQIFPEDYYSYDEKPPSVQRRDKAVELIKKSCSGKPY
jgi:hypothetical protein